MGVAGTTGASGSDSRTGSGTSATGSTTGSGAGGSSSATATGSTDGGGVSASTIFFTSALSLSSLLDCQASTFANTWSGIWSTLVSSVVTRPSMLVIRSSYSDMSGHSGATKTAGSGADSSTSCATGVSSATGAGAAPLSTSRYVLTALAELGGGADPPESASK